MLNWRTVLAWEVDPAQFKPGDNVQLNLTGEFDADYYGDVYSEWLEDMPDEDYAGFVRSWPEMVGTVMKDETDEAKLNGRFYRVYWPKLAPWTFTSEISMAEKDLVQV